MKQVQIPIKPLTISKAWQGRRFKTAEYKKWQQDFCNLVGKHEPIKGDRLSLTVEFYIKNDKTTDQDNFFKTLLDTLKMAGIIEDDRYIYEIHAYKYHSKDERINVVICES